VDISGLALMRTGETEMKQAVKQAGNALQVNSLVIRLLEPFLLGCK
jgi:hypothetical protein